MAAFFTTHPCKAKMKVTTIQIFVNHSHDICPPIAVPGFIHIIPYLLYYRQFSISACITSNGFVRSSIDNETLGFPAWRENREMTSTLEASIRMGARNGGMRNICELLLNVVMFDRPKMLLGLGQKARGTDRVFVSRST